MKTKIKITTSTIAYTLALVLLLLGHLSSKAAPVKNTIPDSIMQAYTVVQHASQFWGVPTDSAISNLDEYAKTPLGKAAEELFLAQYELKEAKQEIFRHQMYLVAAVVFCIGFYFLFIHRVRKLQAKHDIELQKIKFDRMVEEELFTNNSNPNKMFNHSNPERLAKLAGDFIISKITERMKPAAFFTLLQSLGMIEDSKSRQNNTIASIPYRTKIREYVLKNTTFSEIRKWRDDIVYTKEGPDDNAVQHFESILSSTFLAGMLKDDKAYQPVH